MLQDSLGHTRHSHLLRALTVSDRPNERSLVSPYVMFNSAFDKEREINGVEKRVDLVGRLRGRRQGATDDA